MDTYAGPEWGTNGDSGYTLESDTDGLQACMLGFHLSSSSLVWVVLSIKQELKLKMSVYYWDCLENILTIPVGTSKHIHCAFNKMPFLFECNHD